MKIRNGFVSNSSSSSFCILGCMVSQLGIQNDKDYNEEDYGEIYEIAEKAGLDFETGLENYGEDEEFVGIEPDKLDEFKTIKELKLEIAFKIKEALKLENVRVEDIESKVRFYSDGGFTG